MKFSPILIVIVEDNERDLKTCEEELKIQAGVRGIAIEIKTYGTCYEAVVGITRKAPVVMSVDMGFPVRPGEPVTDQLMGMRLVRIAGNSIPVIIHSGLDKRLIQAAKPDFPEHRIIHKASNVSPITWAKAVLDAIPRG